MHLPPKLAEIYAQAQCNPDQNRPLIAELKALASIAQDSRMDTAPLSLGPPPSRCQLCGQELHDQFDAEI